MFVLANFLEAFGRVVDWAIWLYTWILVIRVLISWVSADPYNPIVRTIVMLTEPLLRRIRKVVPYIRMGAGYLDLSPIILLLILQFMNYFLVRTILEFAVRVRGM